MSFAIVLIRGVATVVTEAVRPVPVVSVRLIHAPAIGFSVAVQSNQNTIIVNAPLYLH